MKERGLTIPELILIAGTRVGFGIGVGLLISDVLSHDRRRGAGWALVAFGALTTVPLAMGLLSKPSLVERA